MTTNLDKKGDKELMELGGALGVENARWLSRGQLVAAIERHDAARVREVLRPKWNWRFGRVTKAVAVAMAFAGAGAGIGLWYVLSSRGPADPGGIVGLIEDELRLNDESPDSAQSEIYGSSPHVPPPRATILARHVTSAMGAYAMALRDMVQGDYDSARAVLAIEDFPSVSKACRALGRLETYARNYDAALAAYERLELFQGGTSARTLSDIAATRYRIGDSRGALEAYAGALGRLEAAAAATAHDRIVAMNNVAVLHALSGEYSAAEDYYLRARELSRNRRDRPSRDGTFVLEQLAGLYQEWGRVGEAKSMFEELLAARAGTISIGRNKSEGLFLQSTIRTLDGDYAGALDAYARGVAIFEDEQGVEHPSFPYLMRTLSDLYSASGDTAMAAFHMQRGIDGIETMVGKQHPRYAQALGAAAGFYRGLGDDRRAVEFLREAIAIGDANDQRKTPDYAMAQLALAACLQGVGKYAAALPLSEEAVAALGATLGTGNPKFTGAKIELALLYGELDRGAEAKALVEEALAPEASGREAPLLDRVRWRTQATVLDQALGQTESALARIDEAEGMFVNVHDDRHPNMAYFDSMRGQILMRAGRFDEARRAFDRALGCIDAAFGEGHPSRAAILNNIALACEAANDFTGAVENAERAVTILEGTAGKTSAPYLQVIANLAAISTSAGQLERARALFEEVAQLDAALGAEGKSGYSDHLGNAAELHRLIEDLDASERLHRRAIEAVEQVRPATDINLVPLLRGYAKLLRQMGRGGEADAQELRAESIARAHAPANPPRMRGPMHPAFLP